MNFKIATWNVNSLRVRLPHVLEWIEKAKPDVLALQEIKLTDEYFPSEALQAAGYHAVFSGQKTYNGVAILSREKVDDLIIDFPSLEDPERRILGVMLGDIRILNLYVPNGESVDSAKYQYKLNWLQNLDLFLKAELQKHPNMIVLGDFNIAPEEIDVHNPKRWMNKVLFSELERQAFRDMLQVGFNDCFRLHASNEKAFTWWDYRLKAFERNWGLRIDHILASTALSAQCTSCAIDKQPRSWERPSDHTPVIAEFSC